RPGDAAPGARKGPAESTPFVWRKPDLPAIALSLAAGFFLFCFFYGHGTRWGDEIMRAVRTPTMIGRWDFIQAHWTEIKSALPKTLEYWGGQQKAPRLPGRHDFYLTLMLAYELPILIAAVFGIMRAS